eukprot:scaffold8374_cov175-Amphora_coffeaeformis.AAC.109
MKKSKQVIICLIGAVTLSLVQLLPEGLGIAATDSRKLDSSLSLVTPFLQLHNDEPKNSTHVTTALCHKTLFSTPDLNSIGLWAKYHNLLGFDHIFIGYMPEIANLPNFDTLQLTPYITLYENRLGRLKSKSDGNLVMTKGKGDQIWDQDMCLQKLAKDYDWVMLQDSDEFLWFNKKVDVKEFLSEFHNFNYISFGKYIYSASQSVQIEHVDPFGLAKFPFTLGSFCFASGNPGKNYCPDWRGRSKLMVRPVYFPHVFSGHTGVKGKLNSTKGQIHLQTDQAHLKEWPAIFKADRRITKRAPETYIVVDKSAEAQALQVHNSLSKAYKRYRGRKFQVIHDDKLQEWLAFVASRENSVSLMHSIRR